MSTELPASDRNGDDQSPPALTGRERGERLLRLVPPRLEIISWGGFLPPWKKGPITEEPPPRSR